MSSVEVKIGLGYIIGKIGEITLSRSVLLLFTFIHMVPWDLLQRAGKPQLGFVCTVRVVAPLKPEGMLS